MTIRSTGRSRERIVLFGMEGVGKSLAALDIASRIDGTLYVIDNDNAWDRMLEGQTIDGQTVEVKEEQRWHGSGWTCDTSWTVEGGNIIVYHADGWVANTSAIANIALEAGPDDWCCIDTGSALWDDVQAWFTESVFSTSMEDYFMQVRMEKAAAEKQAKALGALDGWVDWPVINAQYKAKVMKFLVTPPCHLIVTCEQADVTKEETDKETRALYGKLNVKPRGQKRIGHNVQTVLMLRRDRGGSYYVTTVKDRGGREEMDNVEVTGRGFGEWYLEEVAGWTDTSTNEPTEKPLQGSVVAKTVAKKIIAKKG